MISPQQQAQRNPHIVDHERQLCKKSMFMPRVTSTAVKGNRNKA